MVVLSIVAVIAVAVAIVAIGYPLAMQRLEPFNLEDSPREDFSEQSALIEALSELEQSHQMGKLSPEDYESQRSRLEREYIASVKGDAKGREPEA